MTEEERRVYQSTTLGMPALKMVLVHARNEAQNASAPGLAAPLQALPSDENEAPLDKEQAVRKIIELLEGMDR